MLLQRLWKSDSGCEINGKMSSKIVIQKKVNLVEGKEEYQVNTANRFAALENGRYCRALSSIGERIENSAKQVSA
jgi:hypothetical protein